MGQSAETAVANSIIIPVTSKSFFIMVVKLLTLFVIRVRKLTLSLRSFPYEEEGRHTLSETRTSLQSRGRNALYSDVSINPLYHRRVRIEGMKSSDALSRDAKSDLWRNTLAQIPSVFGRLVYLSSLRDSNTGRYLHHGLALVFGEDEARKALRKSHEQAFAEWLSFNLEQQQADLRLYLSDVSEDKRTVLETWQKLEPYKNLLPKSAKSVERQLYLGDLTILLALLKTEFGVEDPGPDS